MMLGRLVVSLVVLCWSGVVFAEPPVPAPEPDASKEPASPAPTPTPPSAPEPATPQPEPQPTPPPQAPVPVTVTPPVATGPTIVTGRVTDVLGRSVPDVRVYVLPRRGKPLRTKTNKDGRYRMEVPAPGTYGIVIAIGKAHTFRTVIAKQGATNTLDIDAELDVEGGEVIRIEDRKRPMPEVVPKPKQDTQKSLPYTDEAVARDAWARAWLLLDIDETGRVTRLKLLKKPGFGLERICLDEAFKLRFDPARDKAGKPMKNYMLWTMEWPSWGWLVQGNGTALRRPPDEREVHAYTQNFRDGYAPPKFITRGAKQVPVKEGGAMWNATPTGGAFPHALGRVPCWGSGPLNLDLQNRAYRDCSQPDMRLAVSLPWITRETSATALAEMSAPEMILVEEPAKGSPVLKYIGAGVSATFAIAALASFVQYDRYHSRVVDHGLRVTFDRDAIARDEARRDRWKNIAIGMTAATLLVSGATLFLWNRHEPNFSLHLAPSETGASATFGTSW
jgi:hypothetical protein